MTAAAGATAYAGIPLTHRDYAQSATFITGHFGAENSPLDWARLAQSGQTLAIYMGSLKAAEISAQLIANGREGDTPVAVIRAAPAPISKRRPAHYNSLKARRKTPRCPP